MEEGSLFSRLQVQLSSIQKILSGWLQRMNGSRLWSGHPPFRIRTAVGALLCVTLVSLVYLAFAVSNLGDTHLPDKRSHISSSRTLNTLGRSQQTKEPKSHEPDSLALTKQKPDSSLQQRLANQTNLEGVSLPLKPKFSFDPSEAFSIILQTYNRSDILFRMLNHYCAMGGLDRIVVVWNNVNATPPVEEWERLGPHPVPVRFVIQQQNKVRNRLQPFPEIQTSGDIYSYSNVVMTTL